MNEKTCCICGPLLTDGKCMSCGHAQCAECDVYVKRPTIEELQAQNVILGMGILEIGETATEQAIRDKAIAIHTQSQAAHAPSAVEAEIAKLKAKVARLSAPVSDEERFHFDDDDVLGALIVTDYLRDRIIHMLSGHTSGEKWSLYRAVVKLAISARSTPPAHGDAPAQEEQP